MFTHCFTAFVDEDSGTVTDFAVASFSPRAIVATGSGNEEAANIAARAVSEKWKLASLGGLDALRRVASTHPTKEVKELAAAHTDVAYDFLADNGFALAWESIFPEDDEPESAGAAALLAAEFVSGACRTGAIKRKTVAGNVSVWPLTTFDDTSCRLRFRSVTEAKFASEQFSPDQSWMTSGIIDVPAETAWL